MLHIYADESHQNAHPFMLYGMLVVAPGTVERSFEEAAAAFRSRHRWGAGELKWEKVSRKMLPQYQEFVDLFIDDARLTYQAVAFDCSKLPKVTSAIENETQFYELYGEALHRVIDINEEHVVYIDDRTDAVRNRQHDLKKTINGRCRADQMAAGLRPFDVVKDLQPRDSKRLNQIQVVDILTGAIGFSLAERDLLAESSPAKCELLAYVEGRLGCGKMRECVSVGRFGVCWGPESEKVAAGS
jgi:hypothetical protein